VIQTWIHTNRKQTGSPARLEMRFSGSLSVSLCANIENSDYQPKTVGQDRLGRKI